MDRGRSEGSTYKSISKSWQIFYSGLPLFCAANFCSSFSRMSGRSKSRSATIVLPALVGAEKIKFLFYSRTGRLDKHSIYQGNNSFKAF